MDAFIVKEKKCTVSSGGSPHSEALLPLVPPMGHSNLLRKFGIEGSSGAPNGALKFAK